MTTPGVVRRVTGQIEFDDGELVKFSISEFGEISRWGNTTWNLGRAVDVTEAMAKVIGSE